MPDNQTNKQPRLWTNIFIRVGIVTALAGVCRQMYMSAFPQYLADQGFSATQMGLVASGYTIVAMITRILSGNLVDKKGRRSMLLLGLFLFGLPIVGFLFANHMPMGAMAMGLIVLFRMSQGIGSSLTSISTGTMAPDVLHPARMKEGIGYYGLFNNLATAVGPAMGIGMLLAGQSDKYFIFSLSMIVLALPVAFSLNYEKKQPKAEPVEEVKAPAEDTSNMTLLQKLSATLIYKKALPAAAIFALVSFSTTSVSNFVSPYATEMGISVVGRFFTVQAFAMILARMSSGKIANKLGNFRTLQLGIGIDMLAFVTLALMKNDMMLYAAAILRGLGGGINMPILNVLAVQTASRENRGKATSTYYAAFDVGSGIGAAVWGVVADMFGQPGAMVPGYRVVYAGAAVFYLITMGAAYLLIGRKENEA
ncbi:MAG: MFS transporter [Clostridia bacterium]|nr:MFS transporter [Clostridia bacterium]